MLPHRAEGTGIAWAKRVHWWVVLEYFREARSRGASEKYLLNVLSSLSSEIDCQPEGDIDPEQVLYLVEGKQFGYGSKDGWDDYHR